MFATQIYVLLQYFGTFCDSTYSENLFYFIVMKIYLTTINNKKTHKYYNKKNNKERTLFIVEVTHISEFNRVLMCIHLYCIFISLKNYTAHVTSVVWLLSTLFAVYWMVLSRWKDGQVHFRYSAEWGIEIMNKITILKWHASFEPYDICEHVKTYLR
jgi:hypothetical protein